MNSNAKSNSSRPARHFFQRESMTVDVATLGLSLDCECICTRSPASGSTIRLILPWCCNRKLRWTVLLSAGPRPSMDFIFEDDPSFQPLLTPTPFRDHLKATLMGFQRQHGSAELRSNTHEPHASPRISMVDVVAAVLESFREHERARLAVACVSHPRLQFELSTLPEAPGLQMMLVEAKDGEPAKVCERADAAMAFSSHRSGLLQHPS